MASTFNNQERGTIKSLFLFRLVFWIKVEEVIRNGMTVQLACDKVYQEYRQRESVANILRSMKRDKMMGK